MSSYVKVTKDLIPFSLLQPVSCTPRTTYKTVTSEADLQDMFEQLDKEEIVAFDFETKGTEYFLPDQVPVGVGFAATCGLFYVPLGEVDPEDKEEFLLDEEKTINVLEAICDLNGVIAHNAYFDGGWIYRYTKRHPNYAACTFAMYRFLAAEGFDNQQWGLKKAQKDCLLWKQTNEVDLDLWLIKAGYDKNTSNSKKQGYQKIGDKWYSPNKAEMWRAPQELLGKYCALDCESTLQLYQEVLIPVAEQHSGFLAFYYEDFIPSLEVLIEQRHSGMLVDREGLQAHKDFLQSQCDILEESFLEEVREHLDVILDERYFTLLDELESREPSKFKKRKAPGEPQQKFKKDGTITKGYTNWVDKMEAFKNSTPELSKNWENWNEKKDTLEPPPFNIQSDKQMRDLLYTRLKNEVRVWTVPAKPKPGKPKGIPKPSTAAKALRFMGKPGEIMCKFDKLAKELGYVVAYLELLTEGNTLHPGFMVPGTVTGRLSGRAPNIQQIPKTRGTLDNFIPRPGKVWVDCDHAALEPTVLAELSQDPAMLSVYGKDAPPNDIYLLAGSGVPGIANKLFDAGYDADNPTAAGVAAAKKACKPERNICKKLHLSSQYGIGVNKLYEDLTLEGVDVTKGQVEDMHKGYWETFFGVKQYGWALKREWQARGGFIINGTGRPIPVAEEKLKDLVNRSCQSFGHDLHLKYIRIIRNLFSRDGIDITWIISDFHDQSIVECWEKDAEQVKYLMGVEAYVILNGEIEMEIPLKGDAQIIRTLTEAKIEE